MTLIDSNLMDICNEYQAFDAEKRAYLAENAFADIEVAYTEMNGGDPEEGHRRAAMLVMHAAMADGRLAKDEYNLLAPMLERMNGAPVPYDKAVSLIDVTTSGEEAVRQVLYARKELMDYKPILLGSFRMLLLSVCAIDGRIDLIERHWLSKVI